MLAVELAVLAEPVVGGEHADRAAAERERHEQRAVGLEAEQLQRAWSSAWAFSIRSARRERKTRPRDGALDRHALTVDGAAQLAGAGGDHQFVLLFQHDHERASADQRPRPLDDQLEDAAQSVSPPSAGAIATVVSKPRLRRSRWSRRCSTAP